MRDALSALIACSSAAGTRTSHSSSRSSSFVASSAPGKAGEHAVLRLVDHRRRYVEAVRVDDRAVRVRERHDPCALLREQSREVAADVPEPLDRDPGVGEPATLLLERRPDAVEDAPRGRAVAADRAAERERLPGHDPEHRVTDVHRVGVEDPRHHLRVGADVGRRNVLLRPDLVDDLRRVAAREPLELPGGEHLRVADHAALRAAEREAHQRAFPGHPHREGLDLVVGDVRVVADAALRRPAGDVVHDPDSPRRRGPSRRPSTRAPRPRRSSCSPGGCRSGSSRRRTPRRCARAVHVRARTGSREGGSTSRSRSSGSCCHRAADSSGA